MSVTWFSQNTKVIKCHYTLLNPALTNINLDTVTLSNTSAGFYARPNTSGFVHVSLASCCQKAQSVFPLLCCWYPAIFLHEAEKKTVNKWLRSAVILCFRIQTGESFCILSSGELKIRRGTNICPGWSDPGQWIYYKQIKACIQIQCKKECQYSWDELSTQQRLRKAVSPALTDLNRTSLFRDA